MPSPYVLAGAVCLTAAAVLLVLFVVVMLRTAMAPRTRLTRLSPAAPDPALTQRAAESLSAVIRFKTVSHASPEENDMPEFTRLRDYLKTRYPLVHKVLKREILNNYSLLFHWPSPHPEGDPILFCGHLDVAPAEGVWQHPPFSGAQRDGVIWGRGALEGKSAVICLLEAAEQLLSRGMTPARDLYFAFGHDEETGGSEGAGAFSRLFAERDIRFYMVLGSGCGLHRGILSLSRPAALVGVAEKGFLTLRLSVEDKGGSACTPARHTALGTLSDALARLEFKQRPPRLTPLVRACFQALAPDLPYRWRMCLSNLWLFKKRLFTLLSRDPYHNALIRTTVAASRARAGTISAIQPGLAEATVSVGLLQGDAPADITRYIRDMISDLGAEVTVQQADPPSAVSEYEDAAMEMMTRSITSVFGKTRVIPALQPYGSDARRYERYSRHVFRFAPFVLAPDDRTHIRGVDECVRADALGLAVAFYLDIITRLAGTPARPSYSPEESDD